jgi:F-type H+-transporting ATPase subunit 8
MPQIIPFYFLSQIFVTFILLFLVVFVLSKYILPINLFNQVIRSYIVKLTNKNKN